MTSNSVQVIISRFLKATPNKSLVSRASSLWAVCSVAQRKGAFHTRLDTLMASAVFTFE